jgi:hypothetical protein
VYSGGSFLPSVESTWRAAPKSMSSGVPSLRRYTLAGLISKCSSLLVWTSRSPSSSWAKVLRIHSSSTGPRRAVMCSFSARPRS